MKPAGLALASGSSRTIIVVFALASVLSSCGAPRPELRLDLLPPTSTNRVEAAVTLPENPRLVLQWQSAYSPESRRRDVMEVWLHDPGGRPDLVLAKPFELGAATVTTVNLDDYAGKEVLIRAAQVSGSKIKWLAADVTGRPSEGRPSAGLAGFSADDPHLLVFVFDALRPDVLGVYGGTCPTPVLDRMAAQGSVFEKAYSTSSWTRPAVASLFSGLYVSTHNVIGERRGLPPGAFTLPEQLRLRGYEVVGVHSNNNIHAIWGFDQGFHSYGSPRSPKKKARGPQKRGARPSPPPASEVYGMALERLAKRQDPDRPVFLYLHTIDTHSPYHAHEWLLDGPRPALKVTPDLMKQINREGTTARIERDLRLLYRGAVAYADKALGDFLAAASEHLDLSRCVVVLTSDHGEAFFEREQQRVGHKGQTWEEQIRIPLILWGRDIPAGRRLSNPVSLVDLAPTILATVDPTLEMSAGFKGVDLLADDAERALESRLITAEYLSLGWQAFIQGDSKLSYHSRRERYWLYDLRDDPLERSDLADARTDTLNRLLDEKARLGASLQSHVLAVRERSEETVPKPVLEKLEALGYVE